MTAAQLTGADLYPGRVFELGSFAVTEEDIVGFARAWDPLPLHTDRAVAEAGMFGGLIASGAHTIAIMVRLGSDGLMAKLPVIAGSGIRDLQFSNPVRPGMVLSGRGTVIERENERDTSLRVWIRFQLTDQAGHEMLSMVGGVLVHS